MLILCSSVANVKVSEDIIDSFVEVIQGTGPLLITLPMIVCYVRLIYRFLFEKEKKIREGMSIMGMTNTSFYLSWFITYGKLSPLKL